MGDVVSFPIERTLGTLPALGARMGVRIRGRTLVWESAVRASDGKLYVRVQRDGFPVRHYPGDLPLGEAAVRYVRETGE